MVLTGIQRWVHCYQKCCKSNSGAVKNYLKRQLTDEFCKKAREHNYRARSAFKLIEMNDKYKFFKEASVVVDLGAAPGSWCQVVLEQMNLRDVRDPLILGVDLQVIQPIPGVHLLSLSDITKRSTWEKIKAILENRMVDVVISDMAPKPCGEPMVDHERIIDLCMKASGLFCSDIPVIPLRSDGTFLCKVWDGSRIREFTDYLGQYFAKVTIVKPKASRDNSAETYLLARRFNFNYHLQ